MSEQLALQPVVEAPAQITPLGLIQDALRKNVAPEVLKELVALQQSMVRFEWEAQERQAKIDFDDALSRCQSQVSLLAPNQGRKSRKTAEYNDIFWLDYKGLDAAIRPIYLKEGFSISFSEVQEGKDNYVGMSATLSRSGVSREYFKRLTLAPAFEGMPKADAEASAASRVKRYLILQIFNVAVGIDRDEKAPFEEKGEALGESVVLDFIAMIEGSGDVAQLKENYMAASKAATEAKDKAALEAFNRAKTKTWRERKFRA